MCHVYQRLVGLGPLLDLPGLFHSLLPLPLHCAGPIQESVVVAVVVVLVLPVFLLSFA